MDNRKEHTKTCCSFEIKECGNFVAYASLVIGFLYFIGKFYGNFLRIFVRAKNLKISMQNHTRPSIQLRI